MPADGSPADSSPSAHALLPPAPIPPYKRALAAASNVRMGLAYAGIDERVHLAYPGLDASVIRLSGAPFSKPYADDAWHAAQTQSGTRMSLGFFVERLTSSGGIPSAVVFGGGEPLMQSNSLLHMCRLLKASFSGLSLKVNTTGYYAETLPELARTVDYLSLEVLAPLSPQAYSSATNFSHDPSVLYSSVEKSFAFLARSPTFKEVVVPIAPELNDCPDCLATIAEETSFADVLVLRSVRSRQGTSVPFTQVVEYARSIARIPQRIAVECDGRRKRIR